MVSASYFYFTIWFVFKSNIMSLLILFSFTEDFTIVATEHWIITVPAVEINRQSLFNIPLNNTFHFYIDKFGWSMIQFTLLRLILTLFCWQLSGSSTASLSGTSLIIMLHSMLFCPMVQFSRTYHQCYTRSYCRLLVHLQDVLIPAYLRQ